MKVRTAAHDDVKAMFEVRTSVRENHMSLEELADIGITPETLPEMLSGTGRGWVALDHGILVAFAMAEASEATVFAIFVRASHENRGLDRLLMNEAEKWLYSEGCAEIWLLTDPNPEVRANGFYRHLGWVDDGIQEDGQVRFKKHLVGVTSTRSARDLQSTPDA